jgi:anti-sigma regulatory factor (Ser/Thr protein kinase)
VRRDAFRHELLEYANGADGFVTRTLPYISLALAADEPVLVAVTGGKAASLREALEGEVDRVRFTDMQELGRNPGRIISAWRDLLEQHLRRARGVLGIGEPIWPGRSAEELTECHRHETLLNLAFDGGRPWHLLCPYDVDSLDDQVIEAAKRSHPFVAGDRDVADEATHTHLRPPGVRDPLGGALPPPGAPTQELTFSEADLVTLRHTLKDWSMRERLDPDAVQELVLAVNELATNSVRYGGGEGRLVLWRQHDTLICEVHDAGHIEDPLIGRARPAPDQHSGRGLWLVHELCDLVQIRSSAAGTAIRVHKRRAASDER